LSLWRFCVPQFFGQLFRLALILLLLFLRALTPLIYSHVTPYGTFRLDMNERLVIETAVAA
jgi:hypothetical protein